VSGKPEMVGRSRWQTQATEELKVTQTANFSEDALYPLRAKLSARDAARFLGVSASMLAKLRISSGDGPGSAEESSTTSSTLKHGQPVANSGTHPNVHRRRRKRREVPAFVLSVFPFQPRSHDVATVCMDWMRPSRQFSFDHWENRDGKP
jgi:hypothetical protein